MAFLDLAALLLTLAAALGWLNRKILKLPHEIGLVVTGLMMAMVLVLGRTLLPGNTVSAALADTLKRIDFTDLVMNGMLAFLVFAGAFSLDLRALRHRAVPVAALAVIGTMASTAVVGIAFWAAAGALGHPMPLIWALAFGALISPTDPVAVISTLKHVAIPKTVEIEMQGEALFNDGIGIVIFTVIAGYAAGGSQVGPGGVALDLLREAGGGLLLGLCTGYAGYRAMRALDDYPVEVLITLSVVTGTYAVAQMFGTSGPLAVVAAGLLIGDLGPRDAMSDRTLGYVKALWILIEDILNSVLFLLIGLELALLRFDPGDLLLAAAAVPAVLLGRLVAVVLPVPFRQEIGRSIKNVPFLVWAGVRGGISIALALSLPDGDAKPAILVATYAVVVFTVVVQGATLKPLAERTLERPEAEEDRAAP